jgi:hypothetical protein
MARPQPYIFAEQATIHEVVRSRETQVEKALAELSNEKLRNRAVADLIPELVERLTLDVPVLNRTGIMELDSQEVDIDVSGAQNRAFFDAAPIT